MKQKPERLDNTGFLLRFFRETFTENPKGHVAISQRTGPGGVYQMYSNWCTLLRVPPRYRYPLDGFAKHLTAIGVEVRRAGQHNKTSVVGYSVKVTQA